jgi:hypothetical protein
MCIWGERLRYAPICLNEATAGCWSDSEDLFFGELDRKTVSVTTSYRLVESESFYTGVARAPVRPARCQGPYPFGWMRRTRRRLLGGPCAWSRTDSRQPARTRGVVASHATRFAERAVRCRTR